MSGPAQIMPDGRSVTTYVEDYRRTLKQIADGTPPGDDELATAPVVVRWTIDTVDYGSGERHNHVFGFLHGHPFIPDGNFGRTSPILQLDRGLKWVRCRSRIYRLGERFEPLDDPLDDRERPRPGRTARGRI